MLRSHHQKVIDCFVDFAKTTNYKWHSLNDGDNSRQFKTHLIHLNGHQISLSQHTILPRH